MQLQADKGRTGARLRFPVRGALAALGVAGLLLALCFEFIEVPLMASVLALSMLWLAALAWLVAGRAERLGSWFAVALLVAVALLMRAWLGSPLALVLLALPAALAAALISALAALGVALAESVIVRRLVKPVAVGRAGDTRP